MNGTTTAPLPGTGAPAPENDDCAVVVAMANYKELATLRGPGRDAIRFCDWLREKGGLRDDNIRLVINDEHGKPVNDDIAEAFEKIGVRLKKRKGRRLYFYYAGHGLAPTFNDIAMVPANAKQGALENVCYGLTSFMNFFIDTGFFDELVVFMDCCREREDVPTIGLPYKFEKPFDQGGKVAHFVLMAAGDGAKSFEVRDLSASEERKFRGLMTTALIEGLNGAPGAIDANNNVTAISLANYVKARVDQEAGGLGLPQKIEAPKPPEREIIFYKVPEVPKLDFRFQVDAQDVGLPIMMMNESTKHTVTKGPGQLGDILTFQLDGNVDYQLIVPGRQPVPIFPADHVGDHVPLP